ncbi:MAG: penicillin-binding protein 2 [Clostridia bacterium]|nr:penicillin-binding protein 2 [Clostridia bacterium]
MAPDLKNESYFTFDKNAQTERFRADSPDRPGLRVYKALSSRFTVLAIVFILAGALIFYNTAALQLNASSVAGIAESSGISRQMTVHAPRGDILDINGIPLAYSRPVSVLYLTYAGLDNEAMNAMLLDLAQVLDGYQIEWTSKLSTYLDFTPGQGPFFAREWEATRFWQTDMYLLGLKEPPDGQVSDYTNDLVKSTAGDLFEYFLYNRFRIEEPGQPRRYSDEEAYSIMKLRYTLMQNNWLFTNGTPLEIARNISPDVISLINEQNFRFRGVVIGQDSTRSYATEASLASHVIGYSGRISSSQYEELKPLGYAPDAMVGQAGIELIAERYLSGRDGVKPYNIWSVANEEGTFFSESIGKDPVPGYDVRLTLDMPLQKVAQESLAQTIADIRANKTAQNFGDANAGAVVMLDVRTGAVLAMASYPYYDPNDFIGQLTDESAADRVETYLTDNVDKPMLNRAIQEIYAPGSTFKPATAVAALESGAITPFSNTIRCVGTESFANWTWRCLEYPHGGHGNLTLSRGMATSCNMYFYHLGLLAGIDAIDQWAGILGLGELTGIDLPGEARGYRSGRQTKQLLRSNPADQTWYPADTCQTAIGQFDNSYTVIQLATYTAALATGKRVTPHLIDSITTSEGVLVKDASDLVPVDLGLSPATLTAVREAMVAVTTDVEGTARIFKDFPVPVAAKTGTAETGFEDFSSSNGLFIAYAPADNPEVAIAQIVERGAWGSNTIGIAKNLFEAYFGFETAP